MTWLCINAMNYKLLFKSGTEININIPWVQHISVSIKMQFFKQMHFFDLHMEFILLNLPSEEIIATYCIFPLVEKTMFDFLSFTSHDLIYLTIQRYEGFINLLT